MSVYDFPPLAAALDAAYPLVMALAGWLAPALPDAAPLAAVVLLTLAVRAALVPLSAAAVRAERARRRIAPAVRELQRRHRADPSRLQRELTELYRRENASPFRGLLPMLAQAPVATVVYGLFSHPMISGHANALLSSAVFGAPLGANLLGLLGGAGLPALAVPLCVVVIAAAAAEVTRRRIRHSQPGAPPLLAALGYASVVVTVVVPLAAAAYVAVSAAWASVERLLLERRTGRRATA
jgi:YidC/Oxa1 family membrane protein insertase